MGFRIDPLPSLGVPLLLNETEAIVEFRVGEELITGAFSLAQLMFVLLMRCHKPSLMAQHCMALNTIPTTTLIQICFLAQGFMGV